MCMYLFFPFTTILSVRAIIMISHDMNKDKINNMWNITVNLFPGQKHRSSASMYYTECK